MNVNLLQTQVCLQSLYPARCYMHRGIADQLCNIKPLDMSCSLHYMLLKESIMYRQI